MKRLVLQLFSQHFLLLFLLVPGGLFGQMITGVWKGKINRQKVEVKIIQNGDSLTGTSYYYESAGNYRRYSIKGFFDSNTNSAVWWDDVLLEEKSGKFSISIPGRIPMLSRADFNCPGDGKMMLDGKSSKKTDEKVTGDVDLDKIGSPLFIDEWDFVIENYTVGANDPILIDSIDHIARNPLPDEKPVTGRTIASPPPVTGNETPARQSPPPVTKTVEKTNPVEVSNVPVPVTIEQKFVTRTKTFIKEIPLAGDSIELKFYDNAEIDGDSISLFLNNTLLFRHIRLTGNAYSVKLAVAELKDSNELTMVAENLGSIPPNTSYMIAIVDNKRYDAYLSSNEGSSAMIRFVKLPR